MLKTGPGHINYFLNNCVDAHWAGVFYSLPMQAGFRFLLQDLHLAEDHSGPSFIFHPFNRKNTPAVKLHPQYRDEEAIKKMGEKTYSGSGYWPLPDPGLLKQTGKEEYLAQVNEYIRQIRTGVCDKAILSTITVKPVPPGFDVEKLVAELREHYPQSFIYIFSSPFSGTWLGATPETLVSWKNNNLVSMSLAGTRNKNSGKGFGEKEIKEQEIVTRYIRDVFARYTEQVQVHEPEIFGYGDLEHLRSTVSATTSAPFTSAEFMDLLNELHPTPAVGGFPKAESQQLITRTEHHNRLYYTGYLGEWDREQASLFVNLRCMALGNEEVYVFAGGGITADSDPLSEWEETRLKGRALLKFLDF